MLKNSLSINAGKTISSFFFKPAPIPAPAPPARSEDVVRQRAMECPPPVAAVESLVGPPPATTATTAITPPSTLALDATSSRGLMFQTSVILPEPTPLLALDDMAVVDMVRELVAVSVQREAETMAALESVDRPTHPHHHPLPSSPLPMPSFTPTSEGTSVAAMAAAATTTSIHGMLSLEEKEWGALGKDAVAGAGVEAGTMAAAAAAALEEKDKALDFNLEETGGLMRSFYQPRTALTLELGTAPSSSTITTTTTTTSATAAAVITAPPGGVQMTLRHSHALPPRTLAYSVPRTPGECIAGVPCVGPPPARDAMTVLKQVLGGPLPSPFTSSTASTALANTTFHQPLSAAPAAAPAPAAVVPLATSACRPLPHSHLTAAQSEERVQALISRIKSLTGYDFTPPCAPCAPGNVKVGSTHAPRPCVKGGEGVGEIRPSTTALLMGGGGGGAPWTAHKGGRNTARGGVGAAVGARGQQHLHLQQQQQGGGGVGGLTTIPPTPIVLGLGGGGVMGGGGRRSHSAAPAHAHVTTSEGGEVVTFSVLPPPSSSSSSIGSPIHHHRTSGILSSPIPSHHHHHHASSSSSSIATATATAPRGGGGQLGLMPSLLSPVLSTAAPPGAFTPASTARRTLSRFLSSADLSRRTGASPAHFDREHHQTILAHMQVGMNGMVAQRREEEGHMMQATRVKPAKHPQGGYYYTSLDTGRTVYPHDYERVYLAEVHYATEFINQQATLGWAADAAATEASRSQWSEGERARALARFRAAIVSRESWWAQGVEEGHALSRASVAPAPPALALVTSGSAGSGGSASSGAAPTTSSSTSSTPSLGSFIQGLVQHWKGALKEAAARAVEEELAAKIAAAAVAAEAAAAAAKAAEAEATPPASSENSPFPITSTATTGTTTTTTTTSTPAITTIPQLSSIEFLRAVAPSIHSLLGCATLLAPTTTTTPTAASNGGSLALAVLEALIDHTGGGACIVGGGAQAMDDFTQWAEEGSLLPTVEGAAVAAAALARAEWGSGSRVVVKGRGSGGDAAAAAAAAAAVGVSPGQSSLSFALNGAFLELIATQQAGGVGRMLSGGGGGGGEGGVGEEGEEGGSWEGEEEEGEEGEGEQGLLEGGGEEEGEGGEMYHSDTFSRIMARPFLLTSLGDSFSAAAADGSGGSTNTLSAAALLASLSKDASFRELSAGSEGPALDAEEEESITNLSRDADALKDSDGEVEEGVEGANISGYIPSLVSKFDALALEAAASSSTTTGATIPETAAPTITINASSSSSSSSIVNTLASSPIAPSSTSSSSTLDMVAATKFTLPPTFLRVFSPAAKQMGGQQHQGGFRSSAPPIMSPLGAITTTANIAGGGATGRGSSISVAAREAMAAFAAAHENLQQQQVVVCGNEGGASSSTSSSVTTTNSAPQQQLSQSSRPLPRPLGSSSGAPAPLPVLLPTPPASLKI